MTTTVHTYEIFIRATPDRVWQALIDPDFTRQYFHGTRFESSFKPGSGYRNVLGDGTDAVKGVIEVFEPPHRLMMTWHVLYDAEMAEEPPGRVEWQLQPANPDGSVTRVTLRHGDLALSPRTWEHVRLGWVEIIDGMKTLLETGEPLPSVDTGGAGAHGADAVDGQWHRSQAVSATNAAWGLLDGREHSPTEADRLLACAYAALYHWERAAEREPANAARASWLVSRAHAVLGHGELALQHADRCAAVVAEAGLEDFDLGYAREARARALACLGRLDAASVERNLAHSTAIADPEDQAIFAADLASSPWFGLS